jgi:hypothetical protein
MATQPRPVLESQNWLIKVYNHTEREFTKSKKSKGQVGEDASCLLAWNAM